MASPATVASLKPETAVGGWNPSGWRARLPVSPLWLVLAPVILIILGLLGTVLGMMEAFDAMNKAGGNASPVLDHAA